MKVSPLLTGMLVASAATSRSQVDANPLGKFAAPIIRGASTGAISTGVKNIASGLQEAAKRDNSIEGEKPKNNEPSDDKSQQSLTKMSQRAMKNFPLNFGANAVATTYVDRLFNATPKDTVTNIRQLALPVATMGLTKEVLNNVNIPQPAKDAIAYAAFGATRVAQGKAPLATTLSVSGFAAGAALVKKSLSKTGAEPTQNHDNKPLNTKGVSASAVSGFMAPDSSRKTSDNATPKSYDDFIKQRYGLKEDEKFWEGPDGSVFVPYNPAPK